MHQSTTPSLSQTIWPRWASRQFVTLPIVQTSLSVTFGYSLSSEDVVMRQLRRWKKLLRRSLTRWHKRTSIGLCWFFGIVQQVHCSQRRLLWRGLEFDVCTIKNVPIREKSGNLSYAHRTYFKSFILPIHMCLASYFLLRVFNDLGCVAFGLYCGDGTIPMWLLVIFSFVLELVLSFFFFFSFSKRLFCEFLWVCFFP